MELAASLRGFGLGFSLIAAIGAQNAYVLTRGILRNHHWVVALVCSFVDAVLITLGVLGMGSLIQAWPGLLSALTVFGALFLFLYGALSFRRMLDKGKLAAAGNRVSMRVAVLTVLGISLLNPHVYLDTVVLVGSVSVQEQPAARLDFAIGAISASFAWFFILALCGQSLERWFRSPGAWRILDCLVGIIMWLLAISLIRSLL